MVANKSTKPVLNFMGSSPHLPNTAAEREAMISGKAVDSVSKVINKEQPADRVTDSKPTRRSRKARTAAEVGDVFKTVVIKLSHEEYMLARKLQLAIESEGSATSLAAIAKNEFLRLAQRKAGE